MQRKRGRDTSAAADAADNDDGQMRGGITRTLTNELDEVVDDEARMTDDVAEQAAPTPLIQVDREEEVSSQKRSRSGRTPKPNPRYE